MSAERDFEFDIRRTLILSKYIKHWGQPRQRTISRNENLLAKIEVYEFIDVESMIHRFVTIGLSSRSIVKNENSDLELLLPVFSADAISNEQVIVNYLLDIMAYCVRNKVGVGTAIRLPNYCPNYWTTKAILFDEARAEDESFNDIWVGNQNITILWLVPINEKEYELIKLKGLESFDEFIDSNNVQLVEVTRSAKQLTH